MAELKDINLNLENLENDALLNSAEELSKKLGESMQSSIFIALQDAINSKSKIGIIEGKMSYNETLIITDFIFSNGERNTSKGNLEL